MPIIAVLGRMGQGKTLTATYLCYRAYKEGRKVYTNIKFNFPYEKLTKEFFTDYAHAGKQINDCIVFIDEAYVYLDSRMSASKRNKTLSYFLLQTRKKNVTLLVTSQFLGQMDVRFRNNIDVIVYPKLYKNVKGSGRDVCKYLIQYGDGQEKKRMFVANAVYGLYNTSEIVAMEE